MIKYKLSLTRIPTVDFTRNMTPWVSVMPVERMVGRATVKGAWSATAIGLIESKVLFKTKCADNNLREGCASRME